MPSLIDLTGKQSGRLTILGRDLNKEQKYTRPHTYWLCKCSCGNVVSVRACNLRNSIKGYHTRSCGCLQGEWAAANGHLKMLPFSQKPQNDLYGAYLGRARRLNLPFELTKQEFLELTKQNCHYCDAPPANIKRDSRYPHNYYIYNGIDRIDSSKGYVKNNIVTCCETCNKAKRHLPINVFLDWVKRIYEHVYGSSHDSTNFIGKST